MRKFNVPKKEEVSPTNQSLFSNLKAKLGFVPNLYALMAHSNNGLKNYLQFQQGNTSLSNKEKEVINLVVSEHNDCKYCKAAHTQIAKLNGFSEKEILELRGGTALFNPKLDALAKICREIIAHKGKIKDESIDNFFSNGYTNENLIDAVLVISDKVAMNYLHNITQIPIDFPSVPELNTIKN